MKVNKLTYQGALITCGVMLSYWLDFGFSFLDPATIAWRFPIAFQIIFALTILLFIFELPESPRWLILKGREDEALSVLSALSDLPSDDVSFHYGLTGLGTHKSIGLRLWRVHRYQRYCPRDV